MPGWPELASCTASIDSVRMVLMQSSSSVFESVIFSSRFTFFDLCSSRRIASLPHQIQTQARRAMIAARQTMTWTGTWPTAQPTGPCAGTVP